MEDCPSHRTESMPSDLRPRVVAQPAQRGVHRHVAHRLPRVTSGEDVFSVARLRVKITEYSDHMRREGNEMIGVRLRYDVPPLGLVQINVGPSSLPQLAGTHKHERRQT